MTTSSQASNTLKPWFLGFDIGGTKTAVILGRGIETVVVRRSFPTNEWASPSEALTALEASANELLRSNDLKREHLGAIGISCGGPLNPQQGIIKSPPNLPGWDEVKIVDWAQRTFACPAALRNDADACALAEWRLGAGRGCRHMVFLTYGTGMGAGLIINGALYTGANGCAGEVGHLRLASKGPVGFGKAGSFEGFCSGGGIARLAQLRAKEQGIGPRIGENCKYVSAKAIFKAAETGDTFAQAIVRESSEKLGQALALLVDTLNPERIILGSIFARAELQIRGHMESSLQAEALSSNVQACCIMPAELGEALGDHAALCIANEALNL
ncbi:ROK family protein [Coraliomargarita sp. SDUM461004]|uniref:ROK family protein n=1 Tax=Thalassobacterium sedimentorum TaxID=3041258 RepID=A0ABU1AN06_9BACT|nr:ROK family protein [Coraliomargarita sp. SDUM461004]MDQ8196182.1 ROK family protein [Coraliomargarita sp. SDUM461004]